ncbi:c6 transcription factor [Colletotrichum incanum]|uniref:C6 transcription factor n=1 Tax=Colletotrichum incanum TaxID=1573173 RepID=A0A167EA82_COLIC|nr:c6 transcription factor [Colletotrichum incanum]
MPLDSQRLRPLLPQPAQPPRHELEITESHASNTKGRKRQRPNTLKACNFCREKKNACDGKPQCSQCLRRGRKCEYRVITDAILKVIPPGTQLVDKEEALNNADAVDLLEILKNVPDDEALEALKLLRSGNKPAEVGSALRRYNVGLSQAALNRAILPPKQSSLEFELMTRHPLAYPTWAPVRPLRIDLEFLLLPRKLRRDGAGQIVTAGSSDGRSYLTPYGHERRERSPDAECLVEPLRPSTLYDNRLLGVDITQWTDVPITSEFFIAVLQLYLETDHPMMPLIEVDLLLEGLLGRTEFCSRILIHALLAWASQAYAAFEPEAAVVSYTFYDKAKALWKNTEEAQATDDVCTVAALYYLLITAISHGAGADYVELLSDLLGMSTRLELFDIGPSQISKGDSYNNAEYQRARARIAWALFNNLTSLSMHVHQRLVQHPPHLPPPDNSIHAVQYVNMSEEHERRTHDENLFREHCRLSSIAHSLIQVMYQTEQAPCANAITLPFAAETYQLLLEWADGLPLEMAQGDECTHHAMILHIHYHLVIIDLFRPLLPQHGATRQRLPAFSSKDSTPDAVYKSSVNQLKRLVLLYRQSYPQSAYCFLWHSGLLYLANAMLAEAKISGKASEWRFHFRLCMACYQTLYTGFFLAKDIVLSLLSMALEKGVLNVSQARGIKRDLELRAKHRKVPHQVPAFLIVDLDLAVKNPCAAQAEVLLRKFQEVRLLETNDSDESLA